MVGVCGNGHLGVIFSLESMCAEGLGCGRRCVKCVLRGSGTVTRRPGCLEGFHRGCINYLSEQFVPKWDSRNGESVLATAGTRTLLVELIGVVA